MGGYNRYDIVRTSLSESSAKRIHCANSCPVPLGIEPRADSKESRFIFSMTNIARGCHEAPCRFVFSPHPACSTGAGKVLAMIFRRSLAAFEPLFFRPPRQLN